MAMIRNPRRFFPYVYKWTRDIDSVLPEHYKQRCQEFMEREPAPVHFRPNPNRYSVRESTGERLPVQNVPMQVRYPQECNKGLWGGEGIVFGYRKRKGPMKPRIPYVWKPFLHKRILYSEILDKHFVITVTLRTMDLIDEMHGLDNYILKTHESDLCSKLGMDLKREMLLALARKSLYPDDPAKQQQILDKYKDFIIPEKEAEWVGLSVKEAIQKVQEEEASNPPTPLKAIFMEQLVKDMQATGIEDSSSESLLSKLNPFTTKPRESESEQKQS